ncbi:MAG: hypothetical protein ABSD31_16305, partial [Candidatus Binataceae bacterium]
MILDDSHKDRKDAVVQRDSSQEYENQAEPTFCAWIETDLPPPPTNQAEADPDRNYRLEVKKYRIEIVTLAAVIIYAGLTFCLLKASREANRIAQRQFEQSERAWVGVNGNVQVISPLKFHLRLGNKGENYVFMDMKLGFSLKNFGHSPAKQEGDSINYFIATDTANPPKEMEFICDALSHEMLEPLKPENV